MQLQAQPKGSARQRKRMAPENIGLPSVLGHAPSKHGHTARIAHLPVPRYLHSDRPTLPPWPCCTARPFRHQSSAVVPCAIHPSTRNHGCLQVCAALSACVYAGRYDAGSCAFACAVATSMDVTNIGSVLSRIGRTFSSNTMGRSSSTTAMCNGLARAIAMPRTRWAATGVRLGARYCRYECM